MERSAQRPTGDPIACAAGCKRTVADIDAAFHAGWELLLITNRWRCPNCWRELAAVNARPQEGAAP